MAGATESRSLRNDGRLASYTVNARYAAFAGPRGIAVRDLARPEDRTYYIRYETGRPRFNLVLVFSPTQLHLLALANGPQILIFDVAARKTRGTLRGNGRIVNSICFAASEPGTLITGAVDGSFCVWNLEESSRPLHHIRGLIGACSNVAVSPSNADHLAVCHKGKVSVWSLPGLRPVAVMTSKTPTLELLSWCPAVPDSIAGVSSSGVMTIWDVRDVLGASKLPVKFEKEDEDDDDDHAMFGEPDDVDSAPCSTLQLGYPVTQVQLIGQRGLAVLPRLGKTLFFYTYSQETSDMTELWRLSLDATIECFTLRDLGTSVRAVACFRSTIQDYNVPAPVLDAMGWSATKLSIAQSPHLQTHDSPKVRPSLRSNATMRPERPLPRECTKQKPMIASPTTSPMNIARQQQYSFRPSRVIASQQKPLSETSPPHSMHSSLELPAKHNMDKEHDSPMPFLSPTIPARQTIHETLPPLEETLHLPPLARASFDSLASSITLDNDSDSDDEPFVGNTRGSGLLLPGGVNVPLPRTCGASFGPNGQLCTFFPLRARPSSFMEEVEVMDSGKVGTHISDATRLFPTFGNLAATLGVHDESELDSVKSMAEISSEAPHFVVQPASFESRPSWKAKLSPIKTNSQPLSEGHTVNVAVRELGSLLPSRKALAAQYRLISQIDEHDAQLCNENADSAAEEGLLEVADAWRTLSLILEYAPPHNAGLSKDWLDDAAMISQRPSLSRNTSAVPEGGDEMVRPASRLLQQRTGHPLGQAWAVGKILGWAEQRADVQTLACTSALISRAIERRNVDQPLPLSDVQPDLLSSRLLELEITKMPPGLPGSHRQSSALGAVEESPLKRNISHTSSREPSQPPTPYLDSSMSTPPLSLSAGNRQSARLFTSGSASPEQHHRSSFGAAAKYYAQTISDKFSSYGSSPPTRRTGTSPGNELSSSLPAAGGSWSKSVSFASNLGPGRDDTRRSSLTQEDENYDSDKTIDDASLPRTPKIPIPMNGVAFITNGQDAFFDELRTNPGGTILPGDIKGELWCQSYSEQLRAWDLLVEAAELDNIHDMRKMQDPVAASPQAAILPEPVAGKAHILCTVCYCVIRGAEQLCPTCLHTTHPSCLEQLVARMGEKQFTCPTGCGCNCSEASEVQLEIVVSAQDVIEPAPPPPFRKRTSFTDPRRLRSTLQVELLIIRRDDIAITLKAYIKLVLDANLIDREVIAGQDENMATAGASPLKRKPSRLAMAIQKPIEAFERLSQSKDPNPSDKRFSQFKFVNFIGADNLDYGPKEPDEAPPKQPVPADSPIFEVTLDSAVYKKLPQGYRMRSLQKDDYSKGYTRLKTAGTIDARGWEERCEYMRSRNDVYTVLVITDARGNICCTGTLLLEHKLAHGMCTVGHVRDIIVADGQKGQNLGYRMLDQLDRLAYAKGATRTVASTQMTNKAFYEQKTYQHTGIEMTRSFVRMPRAVHEGEGRRSRSLSPERIERERARTAARLGGPAVMPESSAASDALVSLEKDKGESSTATGVSAGTNT